MADSTPTTAPATASGGNDEIVAALAYLQQANLPAVWQQIQSGQINIVQDVDAADDALKIAAVFFPPLAVVSNDVDVGVKIINGLQFLIPVLQVAFGVAKSQAAAAAPVADPTWPAFTTSDKR